MKTLSKFSFTTEEEIIRKRIISLKKDIYKFLLKLISEPQKKERFKDAKNLFSKYNLSDKERSKIEDTDSIFDNL